MIFWKSWKSRRLVVGGLNPGLFTCQHCTSELQPRAVKGNLLSGSRVTVWHCRLWHGHFSWTNWLTFAGNVPRKWTKWFFLYSYDLTDTGTDFWAIAVDGANYLIISKKFKWGAPTAHLLFRRWLQCHPIGLRCPSALTGADGLRRISWLCHPPTHRQ